MNRTTLSVKQGANQVWKHGPAEGMHITFHCKWSNKQTVGDFAPSSEFSGCCEALANRNLQVHVLDMHLIDLNLQLVQPQKDYTDGPCGLCTQTNQHFAANGWGTIHKLKCVGSEQFICKNEQACGTNKTKICSPVLHKQKEQQ